MFRLVMLQDVPILQTSASISDMEQKVKGNKNIIFTYQRAIGTYGKIFS